MSKLRADSSHLPDFQTSGLPDLPQSLGYYFPAEFAPHVATWLSWPHKEASWPGKIEAIYPYYSQFIKELALSEKVRINVADEAMKQFALGHIREAGANLDQVEFLYIPQTMPGAGTMVRPS